ncbi:hypothetical protein BDN71DRAFT_962957 [Pleurotus eryngii]|uniref:RRM domain-containing protein n=1 Tax=Pleurotus eryngii TaxID=5323 RepID=A0A9P6A6G6_PLEER|nr:hypothetical protein BDN71DRAFT_962957 [Pleurotus eryngii]
MAAQVRRFAAGLGEASRAYKETWDRCVHIELQKVPSTTTPKDIRRALGHARLQGVSDVAIIYRGFRPTNRALLTLVHNSYLRQNLKALEKLTLVGLPIESEPVLLSSSEAQESQARQRGSKGRADAAQRGAITGDGPNGGVPNNGKNVVVWGLPPRIHSDIFRELLTGFKLAELDQGPDIMRVHSEEDLKVSKWLIHMKSESEAHRLVRRLHLRHFQPDRHGSEFVMRADIVY